MIESKYLNQVAEIEPRAKKGKVYPRGTIIVQISATKGQILYLRKASEIEDKYAVVHAKEVDAFYLYSVMKLFFPTYFEQKREGLNFKAEELQHFKLPIHCNRTKQQQISKAMRLMSAADDFLN